MSPPNPRAPLSPVLRPPFFPTVASGPAATLGRWQIGSLLHEGSFASIHPARAAGSDAAPWSHVIKRLHGDVLDHPAAVDMLIREAIVGSQVRHPHLSTVVDGQLDTAPYFIVLPRLAGATLSRSIAAAGPLKLPIALWIARQVAEALSALHNQRWLHADVKPDNIMVGPDGHATLIDLGLVRRLEQPGSAVERASVAGTCGYLAPEVIRSASGFGVPSDLYSLGATLYEMLSGEPPYCGCTLAEIATAQRLTSPRAVDELNPDVPASASELIHQLLAPDPLRRPSTAEEVVRRLVALEIATLSQQVA